MSTNTAAGQLVGRLGDQEAADPENPTPKEIQRHLLNNAPATRYPLDATTAPLFVDADGNGIPGDDDESNVNYDAIAGGDYELPTFSVVKKSAVGTKTVQATSLIDVAISATAKKFVDLPDALRRSLVPIIKVYKTFIDENGKQVDLRLRTDPSNNGVNRVDLERIDFIRKGGNPAEVDTNIEFNITLSARELGFYFVKQYPKSEQGEEDLFTLERESKGVAWIDLIKIDPGRELQVGEVGNSELVINETDARMKVFLGYATPTIKPSGMHDNTWKDWKNIITSQQEIFYLNLFKHQFDFKPSGEVGLSIDFIASGNGRTLVPEADIMLGPRYSQRLRDINKQIKDRKKAIRNLPSVDDELAARDSTYKECVENAAQMGSLEGLERTREHLINLSRRRLINQLGLGVDLPTDYDASYTRIKQMRPQNPNLPYQSFSWMQRGSPTYVYLGDIVEAAMEVLAHNGLLGEDLDANDVSDGNRSSFLITPDNHPEKKFLIPFSEVPLNSPRRIQTIKKYGGLVFGDITYVSPDGEDIVYSLLDLPISFELFKTWYLDKVSSKTVFYFRDFITQLMTSFMGLVFDDSVYGEGAGASELEKPKFSIVSISVPETIVDNLVTRRGQIPDLATYESTGDSTAVIQESEFANLINAPTTPQEAAPDDINAQALPAPDIDLSSLLLIRQVRDSGAVRSDHAPRLLWGQSTRGILESVSFQREDIPGYGEARIMSDRTAVANNMMLNEKYNTTLETIGNTAFLPGCQLYLDPRPLDLGFADEQGSYARSLGMGGLYIVNYVEHQMDFIEKSWKTTLDTKWESFGDGEAGDDVNIDRCLLQSGLRSRQSRAAHLSMMASGIRDQLRRDALYTPSTNDPDSANYDAESREEYREMREEYIRLHEEIAEIAEQLNPEEPEDSP